MGKQTRRGLMMLWLAAGAAVIGCSDEGSGSGSTAATTSGATGTGGAGTSGSGTGTSGSGGAASSGSGGTSASSGGGSSASSGGSTAASTGTFMGGCNGNTCDLLFSGSGFDEHDGQTLSAGVIPQGSSMGFDWQDSATVMGGTFSLQGTGVLQKGTAYFLNYYADVNGNGVCEPNAGDHIWRISIPPVQDNVVLAVPHAMTNSNLGCGGF